MSWAAAGDVLLTLIAYLGIASTSGSLHWPLQQWTRSTWWVLGGFAIGSGTAVELHALYSGRWAYTELTPRLPLLDVSMLPLLQLLVLLPLSFVLARIACEAVRKTTAGR